MPSSHTSACTIHSLPSEPNSTTPYIPPDVPSAFLRQFVVNSLLKRGFEGAEAGALAEIERLLERHITNLFEDATSYAHLSGRREANALDLVVAQEESGWSVSRMRKESKRRRGGAPQLHLEPSPPSSPTQLTLAALMAEEEYAQPTSSSSTSNNGAARPYPDTEEDRKPDIFSLSSGSDHKPQRNKQKKSKGERLAYAEDWTPGLPPRWTMLNDDGSMRDQSATTSTLPQGSNPALAQPIAPAQLQPQAAPVTSALLDFIKLTATERGDIPPELGVVDYRREVPNGAAASGGADWDRPSGGNGQGESRKRKWGVKGVGVRA